MIIICDCVCRDAKFCVSTRLCATYTQKSLAESICSLPQGIQYCFGGADAAFVKVSKRCSYAMRCDAMRKIRAILVFQCIYFQHFTL